MSSEIKLTVSGLVYNQNIVGTYGLILSEFSGNRRFSIMIGEPEAQSIAMKMNKKKAPRPLTHDLIVTLLGVFGAKIEKVIISDMIDDIFYSELHLKKGDVAMVIDARTSDAIALAIRAECDIYIKEEILKIVGVEIDPSMIGESNLEKEKTVLKPEDLTNEELDIIPIEDLEELLEMVIEDEKYELAVRIRDAIKRKKNN